MNYIQHLSAFFNRVHPDNRMNPSHISLYMALFLQWNLNRFKNPISINRSETMCLSKIGSHHTYHKCLKDLNCWGYILYKPSHHPTKGSLVYLCSFAPTTSQEKQETCDQLELRLETCAVLGQGLGKNDTSTAQALHPSINNTNNTNIKTYCEEKISAKKSNYENLKFLKKKDNEVLSSPEKAKRKKVPPKKEKVFAAPTLEEAIVFFSQQAYPELEARKFFYHFQANGWKVGGKSPMKDWHAASHNWMLNEKNFNSSSKTKTNNTVTLNTDKAYDIPL